MEFITTFFAQLSIVIMIWLGLSFAYLKFITLSPAGFRLIGIYLFFVSLIAGLRTFDDYDLSGEKK